VRARIQQGCRVVDGITVELTASIGVAPGLPGDTVAALIARADQAMYAAKRAGRNRVMAHGAAPVTETKEAPEGASVD
jgi:diguanylate cyclase (GGDEF)-like protein